MKVKDFFGLGEVFGYFFRKKDPNSKADFSLKAMHTVNKISMFMFLVCLCIIAYRLIIRNL